MSGDMTSPGRRAEARGNSWARGGLRRQEAVGEDRKCWICFREQEDHCTPLDHSSWYTFLKNIKQSARISFIYVSRQR
jgi:hypothetical protein